MLELRNMHKSFGVVQILGGINLCLEKGDVYMLKCDNDSGKTILQIEHYLDYRRNRRSRATSGEKAINKIKYIENKKY